MLTNNFHALMGLILTANNSVVKGQLPVKDVTNTTRYAANQCNSSMPYTVNTDFTLTANNAGISVGSGGTAATESDYQLESPITSGLSALMNRSSGLDANGYPFIQFDIMLTNTSESSITIREIGYKQSLRASDTLSGTSVSNRVCLIDRSVLGTAVTVGSGSYAVIRYQLKTVIPSA